MRGSVHPAPDLLVSVYGGAKTFPQSGHFSILPRPASITTTAAKTMRPRGRKSIQDCPCDDTDDAQNTGNNTACVALRVSSAGPRLLDEQVVNTSGKVIRGLIRELIVEGQASGEIADDDPDQLVGALMACLDGISRAMVNLDPKAARASIPDARVILRMLRPDPPTVKKR